MTDEARQSPAETVSHEVRDVCMMCGCKEPAGGWHVQGYCDGDVELFCSAKCFNDSCDYSGDNGESDGSEDCGRWSNGRLSLQCSKAGSEECDWMCPIGLPERAKRPNKRQGALELDEQLTNSQRPEGER